MRARVLWLSVIAVALWSARVFADSPLEECSRDNADQPQVRACLDARMKAAESALADAYRAMRDEMERLDRAVGQPVAAKPFEGAQQAFRDYRDRHCAWVGIKAVGGSGAGDFVRDCRIRLAEQRTQELQAQMPGPPSPQPAPEEPDR
jgi:uncharacterized protein YecT (DUF1311 family)